MPDFKSGDAANPRHAVRGADRHHARRGHGQAGRSRSRECHAGPARRDPGRRLSRHSSHRQGPVGQQRRVAADVRRRRRTRSSISPSRWTAAMPQVRPGVSTALSIAGQMFDNVVHVPRAAIFDVTGQPTVYVRTPQGFEPRPVKVVARTETIGDHRRRRRARGGGARQPDPQCHHQTGRRGAAATGTMSPSDCQPSGSPQLADAMSQGTPAAPGRTAHARRAAARHRAQHRQPAAAQAAHAADHARDDLRRGGRALDAVDRRRRAAAGDGLHRRPRRPQHHRRGPRDHRSPGVSRRSACSRRG